MRTELRWLFTCVLSAFLAGAGHAQEAEPPKPPPEEAPKPAAVEDETNEVPLEKLPETESTSTRKFGRFYFEGGVWFAQPTGLEYHPAISYSDPVNAVVLDMTFHTETPPRWRFGWQMPNEAGELIGTYFAYTQDQTLTNTSPGQYIYGETEAFPLYAGAFDDGLADAFTAQARTQLREIRFDYAREVFDGPRVHGKWFAGIRTVEQKWNLSTQYYSLIQPPELFPPVLPPRADLVPLADVSANVSEYSGNGLEAGLDLKFPFDHAGKFSVELGFSVAALRGSDHTNSRATNHFYVFTLDGQDFVLAAPFDIFTQFVVPDEGAPFPAINNVTQRTASIGLTGNTSQSSFALDAYLGLRWKVWRELEIFGGVRDQRYDDAGQVVRPYSAVVLPNGSINVQSVTRTPIGTTYEGFYLGVGYTF